MYDKRPVCLSRLYVPVHVEIAGRQTRKIVLDRGLRSDRSRYSQHWPLTLTCYLDFQSRWANVMIYTHRSRKTQVQSSVCYKDSEETNEQTDGRTLAHKWWKSYDNLACIPRWHRRPWYSIQYTTVANDHKKTHQEMR